VRNLVSGRQPAGIWAWKQRNLIESSLRNWQLQNNGEKRNRLWQDDFMCDMKWQGDCYKSVARIRLVKTENPSMCATVNCKVCSAVLPVVPSCVNKVSINPISQSKTRLISHTQQPLHHDNIHIYRKTSIFYEGSWISPFCQLQYVYLWFISREVTLVS
jgi:hypothetical protein